MVKRKMTKGKERVRTDWSFDDDDGDGNWQRRRGVRKLIRKDKYKCFIAAAQTDKDVNEKRGKQNGGERESAHERW